MVGLNAFPVWFYFTLCSTLLAILDFRLALNTPKLKYRIIFVTFKQDLVYIFETVIENKLSVCISNMIFVKFYSPVVRLSEIILKKTLLDVHNVNTNLSDCIL